MKAGDRLGRYELLREIGRGGMAAVWDADLLGPRGFKRRVALKILHPQVQVANAELLVHEARLGALVNHPNVVATLELGEADGRWFLCMERVFGSSASALAAERPLPAAALLDLGIQVAHGLRHLHTLEVDGESRPLIHRDIKPGNLMVDRTGVAKIADLGISGFRGQTGDPAGTAGYAPQEQIAGDPMPASDVFALAASLFALATRSRLLGKGTQAIVRASAIEQVTARSDFREPLDALAPGLADVLRACLRLDPRARPDAGALAEQLGRLRVRAGGASLLELVRGPTAPTPTVPPTTDSHLKTNLPRPSTRPVGRSAELARLKQALNLPGVVAITGPAGVGKSLLAAIAVGETPAEEAWWVVGTAWRTAEDALRGVASALGLVASDAGDAAWLGEALRLRGHAIVVLDDAGHVGGLPRLLTELSTAAPAALLVVTARQRIRGARGVRVSALGPADAAALYRSLALDDPRPEAVDAVVARLDGLPLAIELAAARTRYLPSARLAEALADRFRVLRDEERGLLSALETSWEHLPGDARAALVQLAPLEGAFALEDAEAIVRLPDDRWVLDALGVLVDHHLLENEGGRFWMSKSVRDFGLRKGDAGEAWARYATWLAQQATPEALHALEREGGDARFAALLDRKPALESAFAWSMQRAPALAAPLALALLEITFRTGPVDRALAVVERALEAEHTPTSLCRVLAWGGYFSKLAGRIDRARALVETGLQAAEHADPGAAGELYRTHAVLTRRGTPEYHARLDRAEQLALRAGDLVLLARVMNNRAQGDLPRAIPLAEAALAHARSAGSARLTALILGNLGLWLHRAGRLEDARSAHREALRLHRSCGDHLGLATALADYASLQQDLGDLDGAERSVARAEALHRKLGLTGKLARILQHRASLAEQRGRLADAEALFLQALASVPRGSPVVAEVTGNLLGVLLALGRVDEAWSRAEPLLALDADLVERVILGLLAIRVMIAVGRPGLAEAEVERLRPGVARQGRPEMDAWLRLCEARVAVARRRSPVEALHEARRIAASIVPLPPTSDLARELAAVEALVASGARTG